MKNELKIQVCSRIQEERSERHKYKNVLRERGAIGNEPMIDMMPDIGSYDTGDPNTTNLYLGNLNPKVTWILIYFVLICQQLVEAIIRFVIFKHHPVVVCFSPHIH